MPVILKLSISLITLQPLNMMIISVLPELVFFTSGNKIPLTCKRPPFQGSLFCCGAGEIRTLVQIGQLPYLLHA